MTPKTEAERIDEAAFKKYPARNDYTSASRSGFKAGIAWRDANPLPHPDTARLEFVIDNKCDVYKDRIGDWTVEGYEGWFKTYDEAIDAAMKEETK